MAYETIIVEVTDHVALIKLNRPDALNALNQQLLGELCTALEDADANEKGSLRRDHRKRESFRGRSGY